MKTAVEWLKEIYDSCNTHEKFISNSDWEQAKEMEKEQIIEAWVDGVINWDSEKEAQQYYKVTFK